MFNFYVYVKNNGDYEKIDGIPVFPLSVGNLLDERLDECYLTVQKSTVKRFATLTDLKIEVKQNNYLVHTHYFVVANDKSQHFPVYSNFYKHNLYLIERTKLLEGVYCQSLTFTNALGSNYKNAPALAKFSYEQDRTPSPELIQNLLLTLEACKTPVVASTFVIASPKTIGDAITDLDSIYEDYTCEDASTIPVERGKNKADIYEDGVYITTIGLNETYAIQSTTAKTITVKYHIYMSDYPVGSFYIDAEFMFAVAENNLPLSRWTISDAINRVLDLAEPISANEQPKYKLNPRQEKEFSKIFSPEFTMTQCNLREQLKLIGSHIHKEPRLGYLLENNFTHNGTLYAAGYYENWIYFDDYGSTQESNLQGESYVFKESEQSIAQYCTDVQTNAQNIVNSLNYAQGVIIDPCTGGDRTLRTDNINVKLTESTSKVYTSLPIYKVEKIECGLYREVNGELEYAFDLEDITPYVYEAYEYNSILSSYDGVYPYTKAYGIYYTQGEKNIDGLFFKTDNLIAEYFSNYAIVNILNAATGENWKDAITNGFQYLTFRVTYLPVYEAKFSQNKQLIIKENKKFSQVYNQSENLIETSYYGENIKGVAQRLGNIEESRTYIFNDYLKVPKLGQVIDGYSISAINTEIHWGYIKCTVGLSKDFNKISQFVGINSTKRIAEVSERQAYKRNILLKDYVVIGTEETPSAKYFSNTTFAMDVFYNGIEGFTPNKPISMAFGRGETYNGKTLNAVRLPVVSSAFGNSMVFSWNYKDNYSAGEQVGKGEEPGENNQNVTAFWQTDVPYCDYYGRIYNYTFGLYSVPGFSAASGQALTPLQKSQYSPVIFSTRNGDKYKLRKDSRESLSFNYEIEFVTNREELIVGSAMASYNGIVGTTITGQAMVYFFDRKIGKFENKIEPQTQGQPITIFINNDKSKIEFDVPQGTVAWAILTPIQTTQETYQKEDGTVETIDITTGGDVLLASNNPKNNEIIYFTGVHNPYEE